MLNITYSKCWGQQCFRIGIFQIFKYLYSFSQINNLIKNSPKSKIFESHTGTQKVLDFRALWFHVRDIQLAFTKEHLKPPHSLLLRRVTVGIPQVTTHPCFCYQTVSPHLLLQPPHSRNRHQITSLGQGVGVSAGHNDKVRDRHVNKTPILF